MFDRSFLDGAPLAELSAVAAERRAVIAAAQADLACILAAIERRELQREAGCGSVTQWEALEGTTTRSAAATLGRVGAALDTLPAIAGAFSAGRLSLEQVDVLTGFVTTDIDTEWARRAEGMRVDALVREARTHQQVSTADAEAVRHSRGHHSWVSRDGLTYNYRGQGPVEAGAVIESAIAARITATAGPDPDSGVWAGYAQQSFDALAAICTAHAATRGAGPERASRAQVLITVPAQVLAGGDGHGELLAPLDGILSAETARRLTCDATSEIVYIDPDGNRVIGIGRRSRTVPDKLWRLLLARDHGCVICGNRVGLHAHHTKPWSAGGCTDLDDLVLLCFRHHHLVHEGRHTLTGTPGHYRLVKPHDPTLPNAPPDPPAGNDLFAQLYERVRGRPLQTAARS